MHDWEKVYAPNPNEEARLQFIVDQRTRTTCTKVVWNQAKELHAYIIIVQSTE